jgi:hypothetical protein
LLPLRREVDIFDSSSLDKAFLWALAIERKVSPQTDIYQIEPNLSTHILLILNLTLLPRRRPQLWFGVLFTRPTHTTLSDCRAIKNIHPHQTLVAEVTPTEFPEQPEVISLTNPTEADPSLILMTMPKPGHTNIPLFTHNCQIKHKLTTLILDNGSQKNLVSQDLVQHLQLPTTPHPDPYQLGWVQKGGPRITIARCCAITFSIGPFHDTVVCDVSPLDYVDLLLGLPYQQDRQAMYHAKSHQYNIQHEGHTYVLTSTPHTSPLLRPGKEENNHVIHHIDVSLCLAHHVQPENLTNPTPPVVLPLLPKFSNVSQSPTRLPPSRALAQSIDLIHDTSLPNAPSSRPVTQDTIEHGSSSSSSFTKEGDY